MGWFGFLEYRSHSISSTRKTYKDFETKGNSRRGLQRRVMHQTNLLNHCRVILDSGLFYCDEVFINVYSNFFYL